ncbi:MAG: hypothetical protein KF858_08615 [Candidatus Sumerlaeia bacterium]|nr:hypothetical protein [Candidatus Sumerlaeia bacterium]
MATSTPHTESCNRRRTHAHGLWLLLGGLLALCPTASTAQQAPIHVPFDTIIDCNSNGRSDDDDIATGTSNDCNGNGVPDECDIAAGTSADCNANGVPDECDLAGRPLLGQYPHAGNSGTAADINNGSLSEPSNSVAESFTVSANALLTSFEQLGIYFPGNDASNTSFSVFVRAANPTGNPGPVLFSQTGLVPNLTRTGSEYAGVPEQRVEFVLSDEVNLAPGMYWIETFEENPNNSPYVWLSAATDTATGQPGARVARNQGAPGSTWSVLPDSLALLVAVAPTSADCNKNRIPDECEGLPDCNANGVPDVCDIAAGKSRDCNDNGIPDECENLPDCNANGIPDVCDLDNLAPLNQSPANGVDGRFSDINAFGTHGSAAQSFTLSAPHALTTFTQSGIYFPGGNSSNTTFSVHLRADNGGIPGAILFSQSGVVPVLTPTGNVLFGEAEQRLGFSIAGPTLAPGTYWLETFETNPANGGYVWLSAPADPTAPNPGSRHAQQAAPGTSWQNPGFSLALTIGTPATSRDCNHNGIPDECENLPDCNDNGIPDECENLPDCNGNGIPDECEGLTDCNQNGIPDHCEDLEDCNENGIPDVCELADGSAADLNGNGALDECDIRNGTSTDCNGNGVPDDVDIHGALIINQSPRTGNTATYADINNGLAGGSSNSAAESFRVSATSTIDSFIQLGCYLVSNNSTNTSFYIAIRKDDGFGHPGTALFTQTGVVPTLTPTGGSFAGVPEYYVRFPIAGGITLPPGKFWIEAMEENPLNGRYGWLAAGTDSPAGDPGHLSAAGMAPGFTWYPGSSSLGLIIRTAPTSRDCNDNGIPDECERLPDCNKNGIPDGCENLPDCNRNGIPDECEIAVGALHDCNRDGIPDECQEFQDCNRNEVPDECDINGALLINQSPADGITGAFGEINVFFTNTQNWAAESFRLFAPHWLESFIVRGIYYIGDDASASTFSVAVRADNGGNPGNLIQSFAGVTPVLMPTGATLFGSKEYVLRFTIPGQLLVPGRYWIQLLEENPNNSSFVWLSAPTDPIAGDPGCRQATGNSPIPAWEPLSYSLALIIGATPSGTDCNRNGIPDDCEDLPDCNGNGLPDECDIASGKSTDHNRNGIPDECEEIEDCNGNGVPDHLDFVGTVILDQSPADLVGGRFSDALAYGYACTAAENFQLTTPYWLDTFSILGIYLPNNNLAGTTFAIHIRADNGGIPGMLLYSQNGIPPVITPTGNTRFGAIEYAVRFTIPPLLLPPGTYWIEANEKNPNNDGFAWLSAATDPTLGLPGSAHDFQPAPGSSSWSNPGFSLALTIGRPPASMDCNRNGTPDECETDQDCNRNGIPDECDIANGTSQDVNRNGIPDECQHPSGTVWHVK